MGKKGQKGVHHPSQKHHKYKADKRKQKRRHPRLYWIQDCPDLQPSPEEEDHPDKNGIHIKLTEIHLMDDLHGATTDFTANAPTVDPNSDSTLMQTPETGNETVAMSIHMDHDNEETKAPKTTANDSHHEENHEENQHQNNIKEESLELATQQVDRVNDNDRRDHPSLNNENVRSSLVPRTTQVYIQRIPSNQKSLKKIKSSNYVEFPNGNNGDGICNPYHPDLVPHKYWAQRKRLFHRFDQGIRMGTTEQEIGEAFFSVTPQCIAQHIAQRMVQQHSNNNNNNNMTNDCTASNDSTIHPPSLVIIDAFVGVGGNAIALALQNPHVMVLCIDVDVQKLYCTAHNASRVYHIPSHQLLLLHFDACRILSQYYRNGTKLKPHDHDDSMPFSFTNRHHNCPTIIDREKLCGYNMITTFDELPNNIHGIFLSPPWGGVNYEDVGPRHYHIESNIELRSFVPTSTTTDTHRRNENETTVVNGEDLLQYAVQALPMNQWNIAYFLPRNLNGIMFGQSCGRILGMVHRSDDDDLDPPRPRYLHIELEQNIVNTKLKTVTAYIQSHKFVT